MPVCKRALVFATLLVGIAIASRIDWIDRNSAIAMMAALTAFYATRSGNRGCNIGA